MKVPPFNGSAKIYIALGASVFTISLVAMFIVRLGADPLSLRSRMIFVVSLACLTFGFRFIYLGVRRSLKVTNVVNETEPLANELKDTANPVNYPINAYGSQRYTMDQLKNILSTHGREVFTSELLEDRLLMQWCAGVEHAAPELRDLARRHFRHAAAACVYIALFLLVALSAFLGLLGNSSTVIVGWSLVSYFVCLMSIAVGHLPVRLGVLIGLAVTLPVVVGIVSQNVELPVVPLAVYLFIFIALLSPIAFFGIFFHLLKTRLAVSEPVFDSSRQEQRLQHTLHPSALFRYFSAAIGNQKTDGMPNRCYSHHQTLNDMRSSDTGGFSGDMTWETHPALISFNALETSVFSWAGAALIVLGVLGSLASVTIGGEKTAALLGYLLDSHSTLTEGTLSAAVATFSALILSTFCIRYGISLLTTAELFTLECEFISKIAFFTAQGTWSKAIIRVGDQFQHAFSTETKEDKIDAHVGITVATIVTSAFAMPGNSLPFRGRPRHLISSSVAPDMLDMIWRDFRYLVYQKTNVPEVTLPNPSDKGSQIFLPWLSKPQAQLTEGNREPINPASDDVQPLKPSAGSLYKSPPDTIVRIEYEPIPNGGSVSSSAIAYSGEVIVAKAIITTDLSSESSGVDHAPTAQETHYDGVGRAVYCGIIIFQRSLDKFLIKEERAINGIRPFPVFLSWPLSL